MQEKVALIVPTKVTDAGARKLLDQLKRAKVKVLGKEKNLVVVPLSRSVKSKLLKISEMGEYHCGELRKSAIKRLPPESQRLAELWNWSIISKRKKVTDGSVKFIMRKLNLEIDNRGNVIDKTTRKSLGKTEHEEEVDKQGNWWIYMWRYWDGVPGWFGYWRKYATKSKTYVDQARTRRYIVDEIIAEVDGPHHYAYTKKYNRSYAYAYDWAYVWVWESDWCDHWSWAKKGSSTAQVIRRTTFRS